MTLPLHLSGGVVLYSALVVKSYLEKNKVVCHSGLLKICFLCGTPSQLLPVTWLHLAGSSGQCPVVIYPHTSASQNSVLVKSAAVLSCCSTSALGNIPIWETGNITGTASLFCSTTAAPLPSDSVIFQPHHADLCAAHRYVSLPPLFFQTELIDLSTVDVILISNYHCMMALPYITEHTGFTGTVYATEPTVQIGRWGHFCLSCEWVAGELLPSTVTL